MSERIYVRPVPQISVTEKRFERVIDTQIKINRSNDRTHESVVIMDLKRGVTTTLASYIIKNRKILDKGILLYLVYLLVGDSEDSKYRLLSIEHPDLPATRGRKPRPEPVLTERELSHLEYYDTEIAISNKHTAALEFAANKQKVSVRTIEAAVRKRRSIDEREAKKLDPVDINRRFQEVVANLKKRQSEQR